MPRAPRPCPKPHCDNLITDTKYCDEHTEAWSGTTTGQGSTWAWRKVRAAVLERDRHRCQLQYDCCTGTATEVDHIDPIAETGGNRSVIPPVSRLQSVCAPCHTRRTQNQARAGRSRWKRQPEPHPGLR